MYQQEAGRLSLVAAGDALITRPLSCYSEPQFLQVVELARRADAAFVNLEMLLHDFEGYPAAESGGTYCVAPPAVAGELAWMGFNLLARANNHALDYGIEGMLATSRVLDARGLVHAGVGRNLAEARGPAYLDTGAGRVALLAATSTFAAFGRAGHQRADLQGRPGLSPLRYQTEIAVDGPALAELERISALTGYEELKARRRQWQERAEKPGEFDFFGLRFTAGDEFAVHTRPLPEDADEILKWIADARRQADWVVFSLHAHESGRQPEVPAGFIETFARRCIDAGADVFVGHGPHILRGIEVYRGRPIFYSLGNFIFQNETVLRLPADIYTRYRLGAEATPADLYDARTGGDRRGFPADPRYWESVLAVCTFAERQLRAVELYPLTLGHGRHRVHRGRPLAAAGEAAEAVIDRLALLSAPYDTRVVLDGGRGRVDLGQSAVSSGFDPSRR